MRTFLLLPLSTRFVAFTSVVLISALLLFDEVELYPSIYVVILLAVFGVLAIIGTRDLLQTRHAVLRNYPLTAHIRFILEEIRPEIRQYFLESEKDGTPFSRWYELTPPSPVSWAKPPFLAPMLSARMALGLSAPKLIAEMLKIEAA